MTRLIALALLAPLAYATPPRDSEALAAAGLKRYTAEHGVAQLTYSGAMSGTETVSWDRWGWREHRVLDIAMTALGMTETQRSEVFLDGDHIMTVDRSASTGSRLTDTTASSGATDGSAAVAALVAQGATPGGERQVAGQTCQVYDIPELSTVVCVWEGLALESRTAMSGLQVDIVASSVSVTAPDPGQLTVPDGVVITEMDLDGLVP